LDLISQNWLRQKLANSVNHRLLCKKRSSTKSQIDFVVTGLSTVVGDPPSHFFFVMELTSLLIAWKKETELAFLQHSKLRLSLEEYWISQRNDWTSNDKMDSMDNQNL